MWDTLSYDSHAEGSAHQEIPRFYVTQYLITAFITTTTVPYPEQVKSSQHLHTLQL
jgi:hypothetical protein